MKESDGVDEVESGKKVKLAVVWGVEGNRGEMAGSMEDGLEGLAQHLIIGSTSARTVREEAVEKMCGVRELLRPSMLIRRTAIVRTVRQHGGNVPTCVRTAVLAKSRVLLVPQAVLSTAQSAGGEGMVAMVTGNGRVSGRTETARMQSAIMAELTGPG